MSIRRQCELYLSPPFNLHVSVRACLLRDIATTCRIRYVEGSVKAAIEDEKVKPAMQKITVLQIEEEKVKPAMQKTIVL